MQEDLMLQDYNILPSSTIISNLRPWVGSPLPRNSKGTAGVSGSSIPKGIESNQRQVNGGLSFIDILKGKFVSSTTRDQKDDIPNAYIVEK